MLVKQNEQEVSQNKEELKEWQVVEQLILEYQKQFDDNASYIQIQESKEAAFIMLTKFEPLFKKYVQLIKTGQINWANLEIKQFVTHFVDDQELIRALNRKKQSVQQREAIVKSFNFIKETYGTLSEEEILLDLQEVMLTMAKRYIPAERSFCAYISNAYKHYLARHIKRYIKNPLCIQYKTNAYEDYLQYSQAIDMDMLNIEERFYEDEMGMPDMTWIAGDSCSEVFHELDAMDRKILIKYYLEDWNDRMISENFGVHINTINQKRNRIVAIIAEQMDIDLATVKRNRKSGRNAILPKYS